MEEKLFIILRLGLDITNTSDEPIRLFKGMTEKELEELRLLSQEQGVGGICFSGIRKVITAIGQEGQSLMDTMAYLKWLGMTAKRAQLNEQQLQTTKRMAEEWGKEGIKMVLMKGQANGLNYPNPMHREKGDVDVFLIRDGRCAYAEGNEAARKMGMHVDDSWYKHSQIAANGETIENHQYLVHTRDGKRGKNLDKTLRDLVFVDKYETYPDSEILLPPVMFNALFLTYHALAHFVSEGMHLKQVVDWAMFLKQEGKSIDWSQLYAMCEKYNLRVFLECMNQIAHKYMKVQGEFSVSPDLSKHADKIMQSVLHDKDFVFGSCEGSWHNRVHLITNLFKYRWKYEEIYQQSIWLQIWYYVTGYFFKTEK